MATGEVFQIPKDKWVEHCQAIELLIHEFKKLKDAYDDARKLADIIIGDHQAALDSLTDYILDNTHDHKFEAGLIKAYEIARGGHVHGNR